MRPTDVHNGARVQVTSTIYSGPAGVRLTDAGGEFSAPGEVPLGQQAYTGTVDGRSVRILGSRPSAADKGMMVVAFAWEVAK